MSQYIKYWLTLQKYDTNSFAYQTYLDCYTSLETAKISWLSSIRNILTIYDFKNIWENNGTLNIRKFISDLKNSLYNQYIIDWKISVNTNLNDSKLRTFVKFKRSFELENYLLTLKNFSKRSTLTRLRISAHDLRIETGRYNKPLKIPASERLCQHCELKEIEDEFHFIMNCQKYHELRNHLFQKLNNISVFEQIQDDMDKFIFIMSGNNGDSEIVNLVAQFTWDAFSKRKT